MNPSRATATLVNLATAVLVVAALHFGKPVLMPIALATLLTFLLNPVVSALGRTGMRLPFCVGVVALLGFSLLGGMLWGLGSQMTQLAGELPDYKQNIQEKLVDLRRAGSGSSLERIRQTWRELRGEIQRLDNQERTNAARQAAQKAATNPATATATAPPEREPVPVVVRDGPERQAWTVPTALGPLAEVAATAALVLVLVVFMLLRGRELRNRMIVVFGRQRIPTTTRALDEAAERISRYLLMQTIINSTYGLAVGVSFYFLGLPYALMWGFLAALLRFIPYIGPWLGAAMPVLLSLAVFPGWLHPFLVLGLILVFELVSNMLMEPLLYGASVGVSEVALIVAVAFWTWIWGPIGLALATPLTVCLVVLGKHVPSLSFLPLLMGDAPVMSPAVQFYQRLLAMDDTEANEIAKGYAANHDPIDFYDELLLPALLSAKRDLKEQELSEEHLDFMVDTTEKLLRRNAVLAARPESDARAPILGIAVADVFDELILQMLGQVLPESLQLRIASPAALTGELMEEIEQRTPAVVCIASGSPGGAETTRHLSKLLKAKIPRLPVIVARWGSIQPKRGPEGGASPEPANLATTLKEARNYLVQFAQLTPSEPVAGRIVEPNSRNGWVKT